LTLNLTYDPVATRMSPDSTRVPLVVRIADWKPLLKMSGGRNYMWIVKQHRLKVLATCHKHGKAFTLHSRGMW